ncbi:MAG: acetyl-CoA carboxylase biotin carboxyl carrier protein [Elusimicrobia bacterium]|nr:acetyl-CoA carboxylase biotin carboxyl carrier protein [Elusimicrobiota bacterium]
MNKKPKKQPQNNNAFDQVRKFYEFMNSNKLETIEFAKGEMYVKLVRKSNPGHQVPIPVFAPQTHAPAEHPQPKQPKPRPAEAEPQGETIDAPMSGIFYRAPTPSSPPYIREGDSVKEGQILCIIEAMKVFNEIKADANCVIVKVLVENGKPMDTGQPMFVITK